MNDPSHICGHHVERVGHHTFCGTPEAKWAYARAMQDALDAVMNAVRPLGAYGGATDSPWNKGYTQALHEAEAALIARLDTARTNRDADCCPVCGQLPAPGHEHPATEIMAALDRSGGAA